MKSLIIIVALLTVTFYSKAQDMDSLLNDMTAEKTTYATATFKATRIINGHSIEQMKAGQLDVRIHHRFGTINSGFHSFYGMDEATTFLGVDYGITDKLMAGIGRTAYQETFSGFLKYHLLSQSSGEKHAPVSVVLLTGMDIKAEDWPASEDTLTHYFSSRVSYVFQAMIARKFSESFSLQITPTLIHKNLVEQSIDPNDIFAIGIGGRIKLSKRVSFNGEYYYRLPTSVSGDPTSDQYTNSLSFGFDIETGGHVFQLFFTNSQHTFERGFITETEGKWGNGDVRFGFNISRVFTLSDHSKTKSW